MKKQIYLIGTSVCFFYYDSTALPSPTTTFFRSVPSALLSIDVSPTGDIQFSQKDNTGGLPSPFLSAPLADIVNAVGTNYVSITTMIAAITPASSGGGGTVTAPDIANYSIGVDTTANNAWVRILTVFDPTTNVPTRSFFQLNGTSAYTPSTTAAAIIDAEGLLKDVFTATNTSAIWTELLDIKIGNILTALGIENQNPPTDPQPTQQFLFNTTTTGPDAEVFNTTAGIRKLQIIALSGSFEIAGLTFPLTTASGGISVTFELEASVGKTLPSLGYVVRENSSVYLSQLT
jgi:hypothetical protein